MTLDDTGMTAEELEEEHDRLEATEYGLTEDVRTIAQRTQHRSAG